MPAETEINDELLCYTELANEIKSKGESHWVIITKPVVHKVNIRDARNIVDHFKLNQYVLLGEQSPASIQLAIRGITIDLGLLRTILYIKKIPNLIDIEKQLSNQIADEDMITIEVEIDEEKSYTVQVANLDE